MNIKIGNDYVVSSDKLNWILKERHVTNPDHPLSKSKVAEERFETIGYYGRFEYLLNSLLDKELRQLDINTLEELKESLFHIKNKLKIESEGLE